MRIGGNINFNKTNAPKVKKNVENAVKDVINFDNVDNVDLNSHRGEVEIAWKKLKSMGIEAPKGNNTGKIKKANVSFNPNTDEVEKAFVKTEGQEDFRDKMYYSIEKHGNTISYIERKENLATESCYRKVVDVDKNTGEITGYKQKSYGLPLSETLCYTLDPRTWFFSGIAGMLTMGVTSFLGPTASIACGVTATAASAAGILYHHHKGAFAGL